jgi:helicase
MTPDERISLFLSSFTDAGGDSEVGKGLLAYIFEGLTGSVPDAPLELIEGVDLQELAWAFENMALQAVRSQASENVYRPLFDRAFQLRASSLSSGNPLTLPSLWYLIASGIVSHSQPQLRHLLDELEWADSFGGQPVAWDARVLWECSRALFHLTRKRDGWTDIDIALASLRELVQLQSEMQPEMLRHPTAAAGDDLHIHSRLVGLYHLAEGLATAGEYLRTGTPETVLTSIERNAEHSRFLLRQSADSDLAEIGEIATVILPHLVRASIWFNTSRLSQAAREFARRLVESDDRTPVLELWWAQREALAQNLLDPYKVAIGVQMPTSAGKTLLAEFAMVQALALNPDSTIAYVVPTRALVGEITRRLREDLGGSAIAQRAVTVESAVPVFEVDPTENAMLAHRPDVLVTTPEKLDLLVRSGHPAVGEIALVVVDEAHHIAEPGRGPRLELVLATLKRERGTSCRYLLLTPFLPNAAELAQWLGGEDHAAISVEWRPSLQLRALAHWAKPRGQPYRDTLELVPSHNQPPEWEGVEVDLGVAAFQPGSRSRPKMAGSVAIALSKSGSASLILTGGPSDAEERAIEVADLLTRRGDLASGGQELSDAITYIEGELGADYPLTATMRAGVAFHHAGLAPEVRTLVERLLAKGFLRIVTGTTTLAQGVNFPLGSVIVEPLKLPAGRGRPYRKLQYGEFWNIAGRAGRALKDRIGTVIFPSVNATQDAEFREYLRGEADEIVSALAGVVSTLSDDSSEYGLKLVRDKPTLSQFLQYLVHALRVGGYAQASAEIEDILRSSLVFHRLRRDDREAAERLIRWSRRFLESARNAPLMAVADETGLSLPSVGRLVSQAPRQMATSEFWQPSNLFGEDLDGLTSAVELLADIPEFSLGLTNDPGGLDSYRIAGIMRDWVTGSTLPEIVGRWSTSNDLSDGLREVGRHLFGKLTGQIPWGLGALQLLTMTDDAGDATVRDARRVPAMTYYGVKSRGAIALRMVGVPRPAAEGLGTLAPEFDSFGAARSWTANLSERDWHAAASDTGHDGAVLKRIWESVEAR